MTEEDLSIYQTVDEGIEKILEVEKTDETAENEFFVSGENRDDAEKKLKKAQHRENIEIDFDKKHKSLSRLRCKAFMMKWKGERKKIIAC